jgi:glutathione S-transferase
VSAVKLFSWRFCPFAQRARIGLWLKNIPHELVELDLTRPLPTWFRVLNPNGQVPTLLHEGRIIYESDVLNEYLDDVFPKKPLLPTDPYRKALSRILMDHGNRRFVPAFYRLLLNQDRSRDTRFKDLALASWRWINDFLCWHNEHGDFLFEAPSLADFSLAPFVQRYAVARYYRYLEIPPGPEYRRVQRWRDALLQHPVVQATGFPEDDLIKVYEDYALGYDDAQVPPGREHSSFNLVVPLCERPLPSRPLQV